MSEIRRLVKKVVSGDRNSAKTLIDENKRLVYHIVLRMIKCESEREDICQDVFVKVFQNLLAFKFQSKLSTWIAKITYHTCLNHLEKKKVGLYDDNYREEDQFTDLVCSDNSPEQFVLENDRYMRITNEIDKMPIHLKSIITLYHLEDMNYSEIAEILELPEGTVKSHLFRARSLLKDMLVSKYKKEEIWL